jgi:hypothetical protein
LILSEQIAVELATQPWKRLALGFVEKLVLTGFRQVEAPAKSIAIHGRGR